jgi:hypothetical protein
MAEVYKLKAGQTIEVTVNEGRAHVRQSDGSFSTFTRSSVTYGPFLTETDWLVDGNVSVEIADYAVAHNSYVFANAGVPADAAQATLSRNPTGNDNALTFTARAYGAEGNSISVAYIDPGADADLSVSVFRQAITVNLAYAAAAITSTAADVLAAIEAHTEANQLVTVAINTGDTGSADDGSGIVTALAAAALTGGAGTGIGVVSKGGLCVDTTNGNVYINNGTTAAPEWDGLNEAAIATALYATAAQGALADTATQPGDLGTAAAQNVGAFVSSTLHVAHAGVPANAVRATLSRNPAGDDNALTFTAVAYGTGGNSITITYVDPAANDAALGVVVAGSAITVNLATDGGGVITSTAAMVLAAIEASGPASALVDVAIDTGDSGVADDGSGVVTALASAPMTGGAGTAIGLVVPGGLLSDTTNANIYRNDGTQAVPVWVQLADVS